MDIQQRIQHQRVPHIIDSYGLMGAASEADGFDTYVNDLLNQYPSGLLELALVETLSKNWLAIPMQKGVAFLAAAHECIKLWQEEIASGSVSLGFTPAQFANITGLDPQIAFSSLATFPESPSTLSSQAAID